MSRISEHEFGYDLESDIEALYGADSVNVNEERRELLNRLNTLKSSVALLGSIIGNPVPVPKEQIDEFAEHYEFVSHELTQVASEILKFATKYHLTDEE